MTDIELVEKFKLWDTNIFWQIFEKYFQDIYTYISVRISNKEIVEYLVTEIFKEFLSNIENIENDWDDFIKDNLYEISDLFLIKYFNNIEFAVVKNNEFNKNLKNKLEILSYAKLKNTKNKKINIAKKWLFSFYKNWDNIFEKPQFNYTKLILFIIFIVFLIVLWFLYLNGLLILNFNFPINSFFTI